MKICFMRCVVTVVHPSYRINGIIMGIHPYGIRQAQYHHSRFNDVSVPSKAEIPLSPNLTSLPSWIVLSNGGGNEICLNNKTSKKTKSTSRISQMRIFIVLNWKFLELRNFLPLLQPQGATWPFSWGLCRINWPITGESTDDIVGVQKPWKAMKAVEAVKFFACFSMDSGQASRLIVRKNY